MNAIPQTSIEIRNGLFAGAVAVTGEVVHKTDDYTGREYVQWSTHARTRHFLTRFSPVDGWAVQIRSEAMDMVMDDITVPDGHGGYHQNPAWRFTAMLVSPSGTVVASAAVVQLINCPLSFELGETRVRGKLYQALGLPSQLNADEDLTQRNTIGSEDSVSQRITAVVDMPAEAASPAVQESPEFTAQAEASDNLRAQASLAVELEKEPDQLQVELVIQAPEAEQEAETESVASHEVDDSPELASAPVAIPGPARVKQTPAAAKAAERGANSAAIPASLLTQIRIRATRQGVVVPELGSLLAAQSFLAELVNTGGKRSTVNGGGA